MDDKKLAGTIAQLEHYLMNSSNATAFVESWGTNLSGRRAIAEYIVKNLLNEKVIILDAGSTSYEIAKVMAHNSFFAANYHVITNNLAAALCLATTGSKCSILGGDIDPAHFCSLPSEAELASLTQRIACQAILTAAALNISSEGIAIRARRPDQFEFKKGMLKVASTKIIALDHTKWTAPFDGQYQFDVSGAEIDLVVDAMPKNTQSSQAISELCHRLGYRLHIAQT